MEKVAHRQNLKTWVIVLTAALAAACGKSSTEGSRPGGGTQPTTMNAPAPETKPTDSPPKAAPDENARRVVKLDPEPTRAPDEADAAFKARYGEWKRATTTVLVDRLRELDVGTTVGKRVEVEPPTYRCARVGPDGDFDIWKGEVPKNECRGRDLGSYVLQWRQIRPAKYDYAQGHTPIDDARLLKDAGELLGQLSDVVRKPDIQAIKARVLGVAEKVGDFAVVVDATTGTESRLAELKTKRKDIGNFQAFIVASHGDGLYEIQPFVTEIYYGRPSHKPYGTHALLRMTSKEFTSKGATWLSARKVGEKEIKTTDGFTQTWPVYEDAEGEAKALDKDIKEQSQGLAMFRKEAKKYGALDSDRKAVGEAIQRVIAQHAQATATAAK
jgi:hypothetical protein